MEITIAQVSADVPSLSFGGRTLTFDQDRYLADMAARINWFAGKGEPVMVNLVQQLPIRRAWVDGDLLKVEVDDP